MTTITEPERIYLADAMPHGISLGVICDRAGCQGRAPDQGSFDDTIREAVAAGDWWTAAGLRFCAAEYGDDPWFRRWDGTVRLSEAEIGELSRRWEPDRGSREDGGRDEAEPARARDEIPAGTGWPVPQPAAETAPEPEAPPAPAETTSVIPVAEALTEAIGAVSAQDAP